jgi:hypothetical protein
LTRERPRAELFVGEGTFAPAEKPA